jgi:integrase
MATVNFIVKGKENPATIHIRFKHGRNGLDYTKSTNKLINPKDWSSSKKLPIPRNPSLKNLSKDLRDMASGIIDAFNKTNLSNINSYWLEKEIAKINQEENPENEQSELLEDAIQFIIDSASTRENNKGTIGLSKSRINSYKNLLMMIQNFQGRKRVKLTDVDLQFGKRFLNWMLEKQNYSVGHSKKKIDDLKTVCKDAELNGIPINPQTKILKGGKFKNEHVIYLNKEELTKIENIKFQSKKLENVKKWLLLGCNIGQRGQDLLNITDNNFVNRNHLELIELEQQKTGKQVAIPVLPTTKKILKNGLPYKISMTKFNEYLKLVCKEAKIDEPCYGGKITLVDEKGKEIPKNEKGIYIEKGVVRKVFGTYPKYELISSHVCRRSFATNLYGILPTTLIMQITAHGTEKMFLQYIGKSSYDYAQQIADFYLKQGNQQ